MFLSPQNKSLVAVATQRSQQGLTLFAGEGGQGRCGSRRVFLVSVSLESQSLFARCPEFVASQLKAGGEMSSIIRFVVLLSYVLGRNPSVLTTSSFTETFPFFGKSVLSSLLLLLCPPRIL